MTRLLLVLAAAWTVWALLAFLVQRRLLYPGTAMSPVQALDAEELPGVESIWLDHEGGRAEAWLLSAEGAGPGPAILFFHGNGEFIDDWVEVLRPFPRELGVRLLLVEYPGYGRSTGAPTESSIEAVAVGAWDTLVARPEVDADRVAILGRSLGGGPAAALARLREPAALILQSTFTSVADVAAPRFWVPPFLVRDHFPVLETVRAFDGPVLVLHGRSDEVIPFHHGEALAAAGDHVAFRALECGHNDCPPPGDAWWSAIRSFLSEAGVLRDPEHRTGAAG